MLLTQEEFEALNCLISLEQITIIDDEENEFWNTIRRKLTTNVLTNDEHLSPWNVWWNP